MAKSIPFGEALKTSKNVDQRTGRSWGLLFYRTDEFSRITCWKLSWKERLSVLFFGRVWLFNSRGTQNAVHIYAKKNVFSKNNKKNDA